MTDYIEKPPLTYEASMGVYCFDPRVRGTSSAACGWTSRTWCCGCSRRARSCARTGRGAYWLDLGRHDDYEQAMREFEAMRDRLIPPA